MPPAKSDVFVGRFVCQVICRSNLTVMDGLTKVVFKLCEAHYISDFPVQKMLYVAVRSLLHVAISVSGKA